VPDYTTDDDLELLNELGVDTVPEEVSQQSAKEQRIIAGFEEIEQFVGEHGRLPQYGENLDIFERIYAMRLDRLRKSEECRAILEPLDALKLLDAVDHIGSPIEEDNLSDEELLNSLGLNTPSENDVTLLVHVQPRREIKAAEEIAQRNPCKDFDKFKTIFSQVQNDLETGVRQTLKYQDNAEINIDDLFILDGQKVLVADMGEQFITDYGRPDRRLRVIYDNGTESDLLLRSLQRALNKDKTSRRITSPDLGIFTTSGYIYVLRSNSDHPFIAENRSVIHKIGVTQGDVKKRIVNAKNEPTYLLAEVEIIATYQLMNINPKGLEELIQKFFANARLEVELQDRFGKKVKPREWFLVPLEVIQEVVDRIQDGTIDQFEYDPTTAQLVPTNLT